MIVIHKDSHVDHVTPDVIAYLRGLYHDHPGTGQVEITTFSLPEGVGEGEGLNCGLYGPVMGDEPIPADRVTYQIRPGRKGWSRLVDLPPRPTRQLTVVMGPYDGHDPVLFTCYGGPQAPKESWDYPEDDPLRKLSVKFWSEHALSSQS